MRLRTTLTLLICGGALLLSTGDQSFGIEDASVQEQIVSCDDLPAAVRTAFKNSHPQATIRECAKEVEAGKSAYEISSVDGKTRRDILFYEDGTTIVVEEMITLADLPKPVRQLVRDALADHEIELVEKLIRQDIVSYEIQSKHSGVSLEIVFDPEGKVLKVAAAQAESPATEEKEDEEGDEEKDEGNE